MIGRASGIDPLGDLIDVPADGTQLSGEGFDICGVHVDDISVNGHLPKIGADPLRWELGHLLFNEFSFFCCHRAAQNDWPLPIRYGGHLRFLIRVWDIPTSIFEFSGWGPENIKNRKCGHTCCACYRIFFVTYVMQETPF